MCVMVAECGPVVAGAITEVVLSTLPGFTAGFCGGLTVSRAFLAAMLVDM